MVSALLPLRPQTHLEPSHNTWSSATAATFARSGEPPSADRAAGPFPRHPRVTATAVLRPEPLRPARLGRAPFGLSFGRLRCPPASAHSFCVYKQGDGLSATSGSVSTAPPSGQVGPETAREGGALRHGEGRRRGDPPPLRRRPKNGGDSDHDHKSSFMMAMIISDSRHHLTVVFHACVFRLRPRRFGYKVGRPKPGLFPFALHLHFFAPFFCPPLRRLL